MHIMMPTYDLHGSGIAVIRCKSPNMHVRPTVISYLLKKEICLHGEVERRTTHQRQCVPCDCLGAYNGEQRIISGHVPAVG